MNGRFFIPFLLVFVLFSCTKKAAISGKIQLSDKQDWATQIYLIQPRTLEEVGTSFLGAVTDSATIGTDGHFTFETLPLATSPTLLILAVQKKGERYSNRLDNDDLEVSNYFPVVWKNQEQLEITASIESFQKSFNFKNPSPENAELMQLRDIRLQAAQQFLSNIEEDAHDAENLLAIETAKLKYQERLIEFAQQTDYLLPAMMAFRWVSPENDYERVPEFLVSLGQKWQAKMPEQPWVAQLYQKGQSGKLPILKGAILPDFPLPMVSKDTIGLHQLLGKKLTLVDLWASWCAPCRRENKDFLVPLWDKYHQNGFQIIGYALDGNERGWTRAINADGANRWVHASHLRGDDAPLMDVLRLQTIPANLLLDSQGKVVAKNIHGKALVKFVDGYF